VLLEDQNFIGMATLDSFNFVEIFKYGLYLYYIQNPVVSRHLKRWLLP